MSVHGTISKRVWTKDEKARLRRAARELRARLVRPLTASDFLSIKLPRRTAHAIKNQAARMNLYKPTRVVQPWSPREKHMLIVLAQKRSLGARSIKKRGFFTKSNGSNGLSYRSRSVNSIAQKKRREGFVDPQRSLRAKIAHRLNASELRRLHRELSRKRSRKTTVEIARDFGVAPSTIRRYRQKWNLPFSWNDAMALPQAKEKRKQMSVAASSRSLQMWSDRKNRLLKNFERLKRNNAEKGKRRKPTRKCRKCSREWPASKTFFAPSPKRRNGKIVRVYLRQSCRVCYRRGPMQSS